MDEVMAKALREPFPANIIGKRPQLTCRNCSKAPGKVCDQHRKGRCQECDQWMSGAHTHLDYVGHADITDRFLTVDPEWTWEPVERQIDAQILTAAIQTGNPEIIDMVIKAAPPKLDSNGGFWLRLTIGGVTRLGYGDAAGKSGPNAIKEAIGDGLRNAGMRFGAGLDMWRKETPESSETPSAPQPPVQQRTDHAWLTGMEQRLAAAASGQELLTLANEIEAKMQAGFCEQVHYDHLWVLGKRREQEVAAEQPPTPPDDAAEPAPAAPETPTAPASHAESFAQRLEQATTAEDIASVKTAVMAAFKAQDLNPTDGNKLLRAIKAKQNNLEAMAA